MTRIRAAAAVLNQTPLDWAGNQSNIVAAIAAGRQEGVQLLCLPELCITGYGCEDAFFGMGVEETALKVLSDILPATQGMVVSLGLPILHKNALFNCACLAVNGQVAGFVAKRFLCGDGLHYEPRWFKPWPAGVRDTLRFDDHDLSIGDLIFDCGGVKIGFEICEDAWVAGRPGGGMSHEAVDVILNPSASHFAFGKFEVRKRLVLEGSRAFHVGYIYANLLGNEAGRVIYDGGALIASGGNLLAAGPRLSFAPWRLTAATIDVTANRMSIARLASFEPSLGGPGPMEVPAVFNWTDAEPHAEKRGQSPFAGTAQGVLRTNGDCPLFSADWESSPRLKEEEFTRAVALGLFDYLRKSRSEGFVVSLSGGADSSAVACLVALMIEMACAELGAAEFRRRLSYIRGIADDTAPAVFTRHLLHCVYQASKNSGRVTRRAAEKLAEALGAEMSCLDISTTIDKYVRNIGNMLGRTLTWEHDDVALQNIQARARGPGVWLLANVKNSLLLSTSNRSEAAVGYATMDGDTCGGLCPIAGIDKAFLLDWLRWLESAGPNGLHPIPALAAVTQQTPTAELRPTAAHQTDEDDLMPYRVLDWIERAAIRDKQPPLEVFRLARAHFEQYTNEEIWVWVERFFRLWCRNQWKRERYAPSFHLDDENLDPKTWCRFPILSGGFARELMELEKYAGRLKT